MKRLSALVCALFLSFSLFLSPVSAANVEDSMTPAIQFRGSSGWTSLQTLSLPRSGGSGTSLYENNWSFSEVYNGSCGYDGLRFQTSNTSSLVGAVGFYVSYKIWNLSSGYYPNVALTQSELLSSMVGTYLTENGTVSTNYDRSVDFYSAGESTVMASVSTKTTTLEAYPITQMGITIENTNGVFKVSTKDNSYISDPATVRFYVTSASLIATESSAELEELENIATSIAEQNEILQGMYADIIAICNQIYQRCGDMVTAQNLTNEYFSQLIPLIQSIKTTTTDIYTLLGIQFALLISTLQQESQSIQQAIAAAELRLEEYLKPVLDYINELQETTGTSSSDLPQKKTDIDGFNQQGVGIDSDGQAGMNGILPFFTTFSFILQILGIFIGTGILKVLVKKGMS